MGRIFVDRNVPFLDSININTLVVILLLQDVTTGGDWVKGTQDLPVLFLTTACGATVIQNSKFNENGENSLL